MSTTKNLKLQLIKASQLQKEATINEALVAFDSFIFTGAISKSINIPPSDATDGDIYIIANDAKKSWSSKEGQIAYYNSGWKYIIPNKNMQIWIIDENQRYIYNDKEWVTINSSKADSDNSPIKMLGVNCDADVNNRLAVKSDNILFDAIKSGPRISINKKDSDEFASFIYQTNYVGKAEFGLIGNDDFSLKVSENGKNFKESFIVDNRNGNLIMKSNIIGIDQAISDNVKQKYNIDLDKANIFELIIDDNSKINFPTKIEKQGASFQIFLKGKNLNSIVWPKNITWMGSLEIANIAKTISYRFTTCDMGKNWYGFIDGAEKLESIVGYSFW